MRFHGKICGSIVAFLMVLVFYPTLAATSPNGQTTATNVERRTFDDNDVSHDFRGARGRAIVTGAGEGSFHADIDDDGDIDGSYFGVAVHRFRHGRRSWVEGHFVCAMWGKTDVLGLPLMAVEGVVTSATRDEDGKKRVVTFEGVGTVDLGTRPDGFFTDVPFVVRILEGGPGVGSIELTVIGAFDGVAGDTEPGNGNYDLPVEKVLSGHILIH